MTETILFLCPHGAAKSVMAAAYFNRLAQQHALSVVADAAGTDPDETVSPVVVNMLQSEAIDVSRHQPRRVTSEELENARHIVSIGCALENLAVAPERVEQWLDVPMVSQDADAARDSIRAHVAALVDELSAER